MSFPLGFALYDGPVTRARSGSNAKRARTENSDPQMGVQGARFALGTLTNADGGDALALRKEKLTGTETSSQGARQANFNHPVAADDRRGGNALAVLTDAAQERPCADASAAAETAPANGLVCEEIAIRTTEEEWEDIDAGSTHPYMVSCYVNEIFKNLRTKEASKQPDAHYLTAQAEMTAQMRAILVDWLVEVAEEYRLNSETLFLAVNYIDRFLSRKPVPKTQLQLVGVTCMLLASKYEEIYAPQVDEFCYITDNTYTREDLLQMEGTVLKCLDFELTAPTAKTFLRRFLCAAHADTTLEYLSAYLCELALIDYEMLKYPASKIAASAVLLALHTLQRTPWTPTLAHYTQYTAAQLADCARRLLHVYTLARSPQALPAIRDKYASPRFKCVSKLMHPHDLPAHVFQAR